MSKDASSIPPERQALAWLHVRLLHGKFDYDIDMTGDSEGVSSAAHERLFAVSDDRLTLLYGGNGTGKTSLLRLLFHALSPDGTKGHRTELLRLRFARFEAELANGDAVICERERKALEGPYRIKTRVKGLTHTWNFTSSQGLPERPEVSEGELNVLEDLRDLAIFPAFLSDSRAFQSDLIEDTKVARERWAQRIDRMEDIVSERRDADLAGALERLRLYLSGLVFAGAQKGSERADNVYVSVATAIVANATMGRPKTATIPTVRERITSIGERVRQFTTYGLIPDFPAAALLRTLESAQLKSGALLERVLTPYLDGLTQRMDALELGQRAVSAYVEAVNSFLEGKTLHYRPGAIEIFDEETGEGLRPADLSSGEKQILLLLSNLISMREASGLFIVDEPELSLNPEWQRNLMPALLNVTADSSTQLIAATHSIEVMARYRNRLRRLG
jgi:energy-coupling factor transporter ATP-binding protein EcfA2